MIAAATRTISGCGTRSAVTVAATVFDRVPRLGDP